MTTTKKKSVSLTSKKELLRARGYPEEAITLIDSHHNKEKEVAASRFQGATRLLPSVVTTTILTSIDTASLKKRLANLHETYDEVVVIADMVTHFDNPRVTKLIDNVEWATLLSPKFGTIIQHVFQPKVVVVHDKTSPQYSALWERRQEYHHINDDDFLSLYYGAHVGDFVYREQHDIHCGLICDYCQVTPPIPEK